MTYDTEMGVFSVDLDAGQVARTVEFDDSHLVDLAYDGRILSIEVLTPQDPKIEELAARFGFEEQVPKILEAIERVLAPRVVTAASSGFETVQGSTRIVVGHSVRGTRGGKEIPPREITLA